jgi:hypothetical protein
VAELLAQLGRPDVRETPDAIYEREGWVDTGKSFTKVLAPGLNWPPPRDKQRRFPSVLWK